MKPNDVMLAQTGLKNWNTLKFIIEKRLSTSDEENLSHLLFHYTCCFISELEFTKAYVTATIGLSLTRGESLRNNYEDHLSFIEELKEEKVIDEIFLSIEEIESICANLYIPEFIWKKSFKNKKVSA